MAQRIAAATRVHAAGTPRELIDDYGIAGNGSSPRAAMTAARVTRTSAA